MSKSLFDMLDGIHGELYIDARQDMITEESADERHVRASLYRYERGRHGMIPLEGNGEWHAIVGVGGRPIRIATRTGDRNALVGLVDDAIKRSVRTVVEACVLERVVMPSLPFALFALDHADGRHTDEYARSMLEMWDASTEQRNK